MADKEAIFKNLKDAATGVAMAADLALEGDDSATNEGQGTLAFKSSVGDLVRPDLQPEGGDATGEGLPAFVYLDSNGDLTRPTLSPSGALPVDLGGGGTCVEGSGTLVEQGDQALHDVTGASIAITASAVFEKIEVQVSSASPALFQLVQLDNVTDTIISTFIVGPGQYTYLMAGRNCKTVTAGATGTQSLRIRAKHLEPGVGNQSDFYAELSGKQLA